MARPRRRCDAGEEDRLDFNLSTLLIVAVIAVAAPLIAELPTGLRLPIVVLEIALGTAVGPHGLGVARAEGILGFLGILGMTFLFFLAGLEIDFERIRGRPLALAGAGWLLSLALAAGTVVALEAIGFVRAPIMMTIALTTTAIGTLLPILRDAGELETPFGSSSSPRARSASWGLSWPSRSCSPMTPAAGHRPGSCSASS